jgi:hypothetical protein
MIGATGSYQVDTGVEITSIYIPDNANYQGLVTYSYYSNAQTNTFNDVKDLDISEVPAK